ncbi:family 1 glycosylhydrolase [Caenimonas aquaedulcis]|uniref:dTDP-4-dehydrorhamnose reductase n=1 Tax=Caenimonas aquaedulcis TaxID=2793270 RepID=A0A931H2X5_9BURK|nr:family 1 glycosylhydrolase [Caenimonas aquaedulcis]MBG9387624.1 sugar nucleotide-binding protein [Caenimonas aquaedulcis]
MALELWAGPECTVNRVGDTFHSQLAFSGFGRRLQDFDRLASVGITRMRFPLVWELTETGPGRYDWQWADAGLARLAELKVAPIAGLLHHGSGPRWTDLLDASFPEKFAAYALAVARRYPQVDDWTPINEPLTTARFSALYGHWYPHQRSDPAFVRALLNQVRATKLAMRAIRTCNPAARLVQTDDLGFTTTSSPRLQYQVEHENLRRWLGFDLLAGNLAPSDRMWKYLRKYGASQEELQSMRDDPLPPDIIGINSYLTSERHLDERVEHYPPHLAGGNGQHVYADVDAIRVHGAGTGGFETRLRETWARYGLPVAITEVHLGCTREEQLRWLRNAWRAAETVQAEGADVRAVTVWAAFGTFDWDSLVTQRAGHYEPGLWDVRSCPPRPTALVTLARQLAREGAMGEPHHTVLEGPGWWQRADRLHYPAFGEMQALPAAGRPLLITGATGTLGRAFGRICESRGLPYRLLRRTDMDIADPASVDAALLRFHPWGVINTAGFVRVDDAEQEGEAQWRENAVGPEVLAAACARLGVRLLGFSSDLVFDGAKDQPYVEFDTPLPLNAYGRAKHEAERTMLAADPGALVVRSAAFFGPWDAHNFITAGLGALRRGEPWRAANDQCVSPTYVPDLVHAALDLLIDGEHGIWHLANRGRATWSELACKAAEAARLDTGLVLPVPAATLGQRAPRPRFSALASERGLVMPTLDEGLVRYLAEVEEAA